MKATYTIDPAHSSAHFSVRHMMISNVRGGFSSVTGTVLYDPDDLSALNIDAKIDASTINTLDPARDTHLKTAEFLDVEKYPFITFQSRKAEAGGAGVLKITGDLTIHGVTRQAVLEVEGPTTEGKDPWGNLRIGASTSTKVKRSDYGLTWNAALETGGIMIGDDVKIELDLEMIKAATATA